MNAPSVLLTRFMNVFNEQMHRYKKSLRLQSFLYLLVLACPCLLMPPYTSKLGPIGSSQRGAVAWVMPPSGAWALVWAGGWAAGLAEGCAWASTSMGVA